MIGLPESIDSRTANSRLRSCMIRAIRNRYFARSRPGRLPHERRPARTAAATALSMSAAEAFATSASGCSVDGSTVVNVAPPAASRNLPSTNRP